MSQPGRKSSTDASPEVTASSPAQTGDAAVVPVSANQRRFLLAEQLTDANYGLPLVYSVQGSLDVEALREAIATIIARHSALRSHFIQNESGFAATVLSELAGWWSEIDLRGTDSNEAAERFAQHLNQPFDLWSGPLIRCVLGRESEYRWRFGVSVHHSIADGVSLGNFIAELTSEYSPRAKSSAESFEHVVDYYGIAQSLWSPEAVSDDETYWHDLLVTSSRVDVPADYLRGESRRYAKLSVDRLLPVEIAEAVSSLARDSHTSVFTVFASALGILLGRFNGVDDVPIAFQSSGRQGRPDLSNAIGLYSNVLVLRARPEATCSLMEYLQATRRQLVESLEHQRCPFDRILQLTAIRPSVDLNFYPPTPELKLGDAEVKPVEGPEWESDFDINLYCHRTNDGLSMRLHYDPALFVEARMRVLLLQLETLLQQACDDPKRPIGELELTPEAERSVLPRPSEPLQPIRFEPITKRFSDHAKRSPRSVAIDSRLGQWRYGELDAISNKLGHHLIELGAGRETTVAIIADRDPSLICAMLGVLKSGAAFVVIDSTYPPQRTAEHITKLTPSIVLTCGVEELDEFVVSSLGSACRVLSVPSTPRALKRLLKTLPETPVDGQITIDTTAYYSFTSGSTGEPKCIRTRHAPLVHFVRWQQLQFDLVEDDRFSMLSGISHDPLLRDIFTPLSIGGTVCIPSVEIMRDPESLFRWVRERGITVCHLTPQMGQVLATGGAEFESTLGVRYMFWGGDSLSKSLLQRIRAVTPKAQHVNFYGATETPQAMAWYPIDPDCDPATIPLGKGIDDVQMLVMNAYGGLASIGELGEICIRTAYLSDGYPFNPSESAVRFVTNPLTADVSDRVYRTGDLGRFTPQGDVTFAGRSDDQVKVRGFRVELGEVTACIERHPAVHQATVCSRIGASGDTQLVGYFSLSPGAQADRVEVADFVRQRLPGYMVPAFMVIIDDWSLLPTGKIDRQSLPEPGADDTSVSVTYDEPATPREREIAEIWQSALGVQRVGVNESLFSLGGDSLTAIRITYRMSRLGIDKRTSRAIFQGWTIRQVARHEEEGYRYQDDKDPAKIHGERDDATLTFVVNVVRGLLVCLIVAGHWTPGVVERLPQRFAFIHEVLTPLFNIATPGFAFVFGVSIGFVYFPMYQQDRKRTKRLMLNGTLIMLGAVILLAIMRLVNRLHAGDEFSSTDIFNQFYSVLTYYLLAVASVPLWFRLLSRFARPAAAALFGAIAMWFAYHLGKALIGHIEMTGFFQLCRLMVVAKFSYFNMSVGAFAGIAFGIALSRDPSARTLRRFALVAGLPSMLLGLAYGLVVGGSSGWFRASISIDLWKWLFYSGLIVVFCHLIRPILVRTDNAPVPFRFGFRLMGVLGQLALPMFLLHHLTLDAKNLLDSFNVPDIAGLTIVLGGFGWVTALMMRKIYGLYYGSLDA